MSEQDPRKPDQPSDERVGDLEPRTIDGDDASTVKGGFTALTAQKNNAAGGLLQYDLEAQKEA